MTDYSLSLSKDGQIDLEFHGEWKSVTFWETIALSIINELYYRSLTKKLSRLEHEAIYAQGIKRLVEKVREIRLNPGLVFSDFGTRRRFSRGWHWRVIGFLKEELPSQFLGTSNVRAANDYELSLMGTVAHEPEMGYACIYRMNREAIRNGQIKFLDDWWDMYGQGLSICLPDTYGSNFIFENMGQGRAKNWKGFRHDSGDPIVFGEKVLTFYKKHGIDPKEKMIIFSDGLDLETMKKIYAHFFGKIKVSFGWGTNLTNDLSFDALSLVIKITQANNVGAVKLSDNIAKAIGKPEDITRFRKVFDYDNEYSQECRY